MSQEELVQGVQRRSADVAVHDSRRCDRQCRDATVGRMGSGIIMGVTGAPTGHDRSTAQHLLIPGCVNYISRRTSMRLANRMASPPKLNI